MSSISWRQKGGKSQLGYAYDTLPDGSRGARLRQGTPEYVNHIARQDDDFARLMADNPDFWENVKKGNVSLHNTVRKTPTADLDGIKYTSSTFGLEPRTIQETDEKIRRMR